MIRNIVWLLALVGIGMALPAKADDNLLNISIEQALNAPEAKERLNKGILFSFGDEDAAEIQESFGEYRTSKRTRAFNRDDRDACEWVFLTAMLELQKKAESLGADAVVNIRSNWKNEQTSSPSTFVCAKGSMIAGVALIGEFVKIK